MTPLDAALRYAARGWPVFPCFSAGPRRKRPRTEHGFLDASKAEATVREWWTQWPDALVGRPMGLAAGVIVLDIDIKNGKNGFDVLEDIEGALPLPDTPMVHTASGGVHVYFDPCGQEIRNSEGKIGKGVDIRGDGGYVVLPSPGSDYYWDPHQNFKTVAPAPAPDWLTPATELECAVEPAPCPPTGEINSYGAAAINGAVRAIYGAPEGQQSTTLNREAFGIGSLVGAGVLPKQVALDALQQAAFAMPTYDRRRPWRRADLGRSVKASFAAGIAEPRRAAI
jgi:Bifunctional DNA primase/polymerase, N-terminal